MKNVSRLSGRLTTWKDDRGFGFITPNEGGNEVFVHVSEFTNQNRRPRIDEEVVFQVKKDNKGRIQAARVSFANEPASQTYSASKSVAGPLAVTGVFVAVLLGLVILRQLPVTLLLLYLVASPTAFLAYAWDKSAARRNRWRTPENTLHLLGLMGGWPGALVARQGLRHKTKKQPFVMRFWVTVAINIGALIWCLTPAGRAFLAA